ncbi:hypothetical protein [Yokenella regensburgei]|uniref:hypothetical protein n=1 Tax=Yokenella regensburgei TaxID=158877 RepID=UPI0035B4C08E
MNETLSKVIDVAKTATTEPVMKVVNQRLSNPFFLCFISSWIICNWDRVLLLLFAFNLNIEQRIDKLQSLPSNSVFFDISIPHTHTFWYPFFASIVFVVGTPFISYIVDIAQNGVIAKKNENDSFRKQKGLDLKSAEITKNVEYENAESLARLTVEKQNKQIQYDTKAIERSYRELTVKLKEVNSSITEREKELASQNESYNAMLSSISEVRKELDEKEKELKGLHSKIIAQQNILDKISKNMPSSSRGGGSMGTTGTLSQSGSGLTKLNNGWSDKSALASWLNQPALKWADKMQSNGLIPSGTTFVGNSLASFGSGLSGVTLPGKSLESLQTTNNFTKGLSVIASNNNGLIWPKLNFESLQNVKDSASESDSGEVGVKDNKNKK